MLQPRKGNRGGETSVGHTASWWQSGGEFPGPGLPPVTSLVPLPEPGCASWLSFLTSLDGTQRQKHCTQRGGDPADPPSRKHWRPATPTAQTAVRSASVPSKGPQDSSGGSGVTERWLKGRHWTRRKDKVGFCLPETRPPIKGPMRM